MLATLPPIPVGRRADDSQREEKISHFLRVNKIQITISQYVTLLPELSKHFLGFIPLVRVKYELVADALNQVQKYKNSESLTIQNAKFQSDEHNC
jgi:hypothetical protein